MQSIRILLAAIALICLAVPGCTYFEVNNPNVQAGEPQEVIAEGGLLSPFSGPSVAESELCGNKPLARVEVSVTAGQYLWNACLGILGPVYTVRYTCGGGSAFTEELDADEVAALESRFDVEYR